ncbi:MAG: Flp pilus assembly complex ATPase component TadA [Candidatus Niyogibacteria bacterium]|nr:Flp pilus assembly complex ATPase component TadA [Candidatus Niyogibacteria bacterium]
MRIDNKQLKAFILDSGLVSAADVEKAEKAAAKTDDKTLGDILVDDGKIKPEELTKLKAYILGIPFVSLVGQEIEFEVLRTIPEPIARTYNVVAFKKRDDQLEVAMLDPENLETIQFVKKTTNLRVAPRLTDLESMKSVLRQYQKSLEAEFGEIIKQDTEILAPVTEGGEGATEADLKKLAEDLPVVRIVDTLLKHAIIQRASDIHIEPAEKEVIVRYRLDGLLHDAMVLPKQLSGSIVARIKILSNLKLDEHRLPQDGRFKIETPEAKVSFRVSVLPVYDGEKVVMRLLPENSKGFSLEGLGFFGEGLERIHRALNRPTGMILATGPTGSGKTTTLYTAMDILNTADVNISTVEDPIEYRMPRVNQSQVRPELGFSFASGLRSLLRQDPDIIMVGEIRDNETASLAVNAALTGHLVLSTLHTNSAAGALPRLIDMKIEPFLIVSTVNVIIAQRLVRTIAKNCKEEYRMTKDQLVELGKEVDLDNMLAILRHERIVSEKAEWKDVPFFKPKPNKDFPDGYQGRIGLHEVLQMSETIKNLMMANATADDVDRQAKKEGMITMFEDGIIKAVQGYTTIEEVLRVTSEE